MKMKIIAVALLAAGLLSGCGGGPEVKSQVSTTTMGQELMDLHASYEKGILSKEEYQAAKARILERYQ